MAKFYLGTHRTSWFSQVDVPLFYSAPVIQRLQRKRGAPMNFTNEKWAFDSGAFMANAPGSTGNEPWHWDPDSYGGMVARVSAGCIIPPEFCAPQDWPCEPGVRSRTGFTVAQHQELTCDSYEYLSREFSFLPWMEVIQGWELPEYIAHMRMYEARGIDLSESPVVGLGSVCRRGSARPIIAIVEAVQTYALERYGKHLPLHGFGMNITALRKVGHLLASADSLAWSSTARAEHIRLPGCEHQCCNNCLKYALQWRSRVLEALESPKQLSLGVDEGVAASDGRRRAEPPRGAPAREAAPGAGAGEQLALDIAA